MKSLLLALGLALCCFVQADDIPFENFDRSSLPGQGFVVATVTSCQKMKGMMAKMTVLPISFMEVSDDELKMKMKMPTPQGCKEIEMKIEKKDGKYVAKCGKGGQKTLELVNASNNYVLIYMKAKHPKGECKIASAIVKDLAHTEEAKAGLKGFVGRIGLQDEKVNCHSAEGMCQHSA